MRIQLVSDTHNKTHGLKISKDVNLVIHAGDLSNGIDDLHAQTYMLDVLCKEVGVDYLYVLGNHDYYSLGYPRPYTDAYDAVYDKSKLLTKDTGPKVINGYTFAGATLWTNTKLGIVESHINDFNYIYDENYDSISLELMNKWFEEDWKYIESFRDKPNTFIVTHFPPSELLCSEQYKGNVLNPYFLNNLDLKGFENWFCGHTHHTMNTVDNGCNLYLNAYGHVRRNGTKENPMYNDNYIVDVN